VEQLPELLGKFEFLAIVVSSKWIFPKPIYKLTSHVSTPGHAGCPIKKAKFPPNLILGARRISNAPNVKFGGNFAFLIGHPVVSKLLK